MELVKAKGNLGDFRNSSTMVACGNLGIQTAESSFIAPRWLHERGDFRSALSMSGKNRRLVADEPVEFEK